jgi:hypothetical protein
LPPGSRFDSCLRWGKPALDRPLNLAGVFGIAENRAVRVADHALGTQEVEVDRPTPPGFADQHDRDRPDLARLHQRQRLEQLVEGAEAAGEGDQRAGAQQKVELPQGEVAKPQRQSRRAVAVGPLRDRQVDVHADRESSGFEGAAIGSLHDSGSAAGHERRAAGAPDDAPELARDAVPGIAARRARAAHDEDRVPDAVLPQERFGLEVLELEAHAAPVVVVEKRHVLVGKNVAAHLLHDR